jgi:hypothetical protein
MRRRHHPSSASGQASDDVQQHFRENVSHATRVGRTFAATGAQIRRALRRRPRPRSPYDAIPLFGRSCSSSLHQRWVCEHGARSLSDRVPVQHCKRATRSLDGRGPAPRPRFSPPETRRDEPGEPVGWSASLWLGALAACDVRVRVLGWDGRIDEYR